jgi:predicted transcriptional regulator
MGEDSRQTTKDEVARLLAAGESVTEIARRLALSKATVCFHKRSLGYAMDGRFGRRYDWAQRTDRGHLKRRLLQAGLKEP